MDGIRDAYRQYHRSDFSVEFLLLTDWCATATGDLFDFSHCVSVFVSGIGRIVSDLCGLRGTLKDG